MRRYALVGSPITHSLSPLMHNAAFAALGQKATYELRPTDEQEVATLWHELVSGVWAGLNVTTPLKTIMAQGAVELDAESVRAGAVNTLYAREGRWLGALTDVAGVRLPLREAGFAGGEVLLLGAGGAARAAVVALDELHSTVHVAARRPEQAARMLSDLHATRKGEVCALDDEKKLSSLLSRVDLIIHSTPLGRSPHEEIVLPWRELRPNVLVFEMIYSPRTTAFLRSAQSHGARCIEGWQMLLHQGAASFQLWTGLVPPLDVMRQALLRGTS